MLTSQLKIYTDQNIEWIIPTEDISNKISVW